MNIKTYFLFCILLSFLGFAVAAPMEVLTPEQDPFYSPPENFEKEQPGAILRMRPTPQSLRSIFLPINVKNAWQALVRSTDPSGNANAIVTTIMEPYNADPSKVLSYQVFEDASNLTCSPSYSLLFGANAFTTISTQAEMYFIQVALNKGWYVISPDYEGPNSSFTVGKQAGQATLDSIRASLKSSSTTGINPDAKVAMWGYSGGTVATGWAATLQPTYAKDLKDNLIGAAMGGMVTNITATAVGVEGTLFAGLTATALIGLLNEYKLDDLAKQLVVPSKLQTFYEAKNLCLVPAIVRYAYQRFFSGPNQYTNLGWDFFNYPPVKKIIDENTLAKTPGDPIPQIPTFIYHGEKDTLVPYKDAQRVYDNWCAGGIKSLEFASDRTAGHLSEVIQGTPAAIAWLTNLFEGKATVQGCKKTRRLNNLFYPGADHGIAAFLNSAVLSIFGLELGPNGENLHISLDGLKKFGGPVPSPLSGV